MVSQISNCRKRANFGKAVGWWLDGFRMNLKVLHLYSSRGVSSGFKIGGKIVDGGRCWGFALAADPFQEHSGLYQLAKN